MNDEEGRDGESTARHIPESLLQIDGARPRPLNRNISALDRDCGIALGRPVRADLADHQKAGLRIELPPVSAVPRRPGGRSAEHTSALQSLMRLSYAAFSWKKVYIHIL